MKIACPNCSASIFYIPGTNKIVCEYCKQVIDASKIDIDDYLSRKEKIKEEKEIAKEEASLPVKVLFDNNNYQKLDASDKNVFRCGKCNSEYIMLGSSVGFCPYCFCQQPSVIGKPIEYNIAKIIPFRITPSNLNSMICNTFGTYVIGLNQTYAMYAPFLATFDDVEADGNATIKGQSKQVNCKKHVINIKYIGKSVDLRQGLINKCLDFDYTKIEDFDNKRFKGNIVLDNFKANTIDENIVQHCLKSEIDMDVYLNQKMGKISNSQYLINKKTLKQEVWLLPIYVIEEFYKGIKYTLLINGQTGEMVGKVINKKKTRQSKPFIVMIIVFVLSLMLSIFLSMLFLINSQEYDIFYMFLTIVAPTLVIALIFSPCVIAAVIAGKDEAGEKIKNIGLNNNPKYEILALNKSITIK